jgi:adenosylhomocysteine nucleosidase
MKIGIIVAMDKEYAQLEKVFSGHPNITLEKCGIGKVNSAIGAAEMIREHKPDIIISSGCAGGANTSLNVMDVVVASECTYHDAYCGDNCEYGQILGMPARYKAPEEMVRKALSLNTSTNHHIISGLTVSGEWFVDCREKMQDILSHFPEAMAVDMESCSIAQTCHKYSVPFISFRVISDIPMKDNKASQYFDFWDRIAQDSFEVTKSFVEEINK